MNRLLNITGAGDFTIGGIGIGGGDVTGGTEDFAHVLGEVKAVGVPSAVFLDGKRAGGDGFGGIPGDEPKTRVVTAGEVDAGDLQVPTVQVTLVQRDGAVGCYLFVRAATHAIVSAFYHGTGFFISEAYGSIFGVVDGAPDTCFGLDKRLVAIGIELWDERCGTIFRDGGVLVELTRRVLCAACHAGAGFDSGGAVAYVVIGVFVVLAIHHSSNKFGAGVVCSNHATLIKQKPRTLSGTGADALRVDDGSRKFSFIVKRL